jgi:AcrR family transcriptional regulator
MPCAKHKPGIPGTIAPFSAKEHNRLMVMGRPKNFSREDVLRKTVPVFWEHGFADTSLDDLERATGVNRSGLYKEFRDKEDLFLACLRHYINTSGINETLSAEPRGWGNVERYLRFGLGCEAGQKGCFSVSSLRELSVLPPEARSIVARSLRVLKLLLVKNIEVETPKADAGSLADMVMTFFSGLSIEQNLVSTSISGSRKVETFMRMMRTL